MFGLNPWVLLAIVLAIISAGGAGYYKGHGDASKDCAIAAAEQDKKAADATAKQNKLNRETERAFDAFKDKVGEDDIAKNKRIDGLRIANGRLVADAGGLLDRNGRPTGKCGPGPDSGTAGSDSGGTSGCVLSREITDDLLNFARDADAVLNTARTCRAWAIGISRIK